MLKNANLVRVVQTFVKVSALVVGGILASWGAVSSGDEILTISIEASANGETTGYVWSIPKTLDADGRMTWTLSSPLVLTSGDTVIGTIEGLSLGMDADPGVSWNFVLTAGSSAATFKLSSSIQAVSPTLVNPVAYATAATTLTDGNMNGASIVGLEAGGKVFKFMYNDNQTFTTLVTGSTVAPEMSGTVSERYPAIGRVVIPATVFQIQSEYWLTLSANDQASGTSRFDIQQAVPEPSTMFLFGSAAIGMLGVLRRRLMK